MSPPGPLKKWHPQTSKYAYNYGVGFNFYQPMIDYIEEKDKGASTRYPHLPWTDERGLDRYDPKKLVKSYSNEALNRIAKRTEASAKERLRDFTATTKSSFQLSKSVSAATISEKIQARGRKQKEVVQRKALKSRMADEMEYDPEAYQKAEQSLKASAKYLRGRSAKAIEAFLTSESLKNIAESNEVKFRNERNTQNSLTVRTKHLSLVDKKTSEKLEQSFLEPFSSLKKDLQQFGQETSHYYFDKR